MTRRRRFLGQIAALPILWALSMASDDAFTLAVALEIIIIWPITIAVTAILNWLVRIADTQIIDGEDVPRGAPESLVEAADNMITVALISSGIAVAGMAALARLVFQITLSGRPVLVFLGWALVLVGVPALSWLGTLRRVWLPMVAGKGKPK